MALLPSTDHIQHSLSGEIPDDGSNERKIMFMFIIMFCNLNVSKLFTPVNELY